MAVGTYGYIGVFKGTFSLKKDSSFASFSPHALKGQKLLAQGKRTQAARPEGAEALNPGLKDTSSTPCFTLIEQALSAFFNVNYV